MSEHVIEKSEHARINTSKNISLPETAQSQCALLQNSGTYLPNAPLFKCTGNDRKSDTKRISWLLISSTTRLLVVLLITSLFYLQFRQILAVLESLAPNMKFKQLEH